MNDLMQLLGITQLQFSKHLRVLERWACSVCATPVDQGSIG